MKQVKVSDDFYQKCKEFNTDKEIMYNEAGRPCVLILKLDYKGKQQDFVVPMRTNISPTTPADQFFKLPPNKNTRKNHFHGIHYIKLFPITSQYIQPYHLYTSYDFTVKDIIDRAEPEIIKNCQKYLNECEKGNAHHMTPDIDGILSWL